MTSIQNQPSSARLFRRAIVAGAPLVAAFALFVGQPAQVFAAGTDQVNAKVKGDTLVVTGTGADDMISLHISSDDAKKLSVDVPGRPALDFNLDDFESIEVLQLAHALTRWGCSHLRIVDRGATPV